MDNFWLCTQNLKKKPFIFQKYIWFREKLNSKFLRLFWVFFVKFLRQKSIKTKYKIVYACLSCLSGHGISNCPDYYSKQKYRIASWAFSTLLCRSIDWVLILQTEFHEGVFGSSGKPHGFLHTNTDIFLQKRSRKLNLHVWKLF